MYAYRAAFYHFLSTLLLFGFVLFGSPSHTQILLYSLFHEWCYSMCEFSSMLFYWILILIDKGTYLLSKKRKKKGQKIPPATLLY